MTVSLLSLRFKGNYVIIPIPFVAIAVVWVGGVRVRFRVGFGFRISGVSTFPLL